jgi:hypothetical protein
MVVAEPLLVKPGCPRTVVAASPLVNGVVYSTTRLFWLSTTQRLPDESDAIPYGESRPVVVVAEPLLVKPGCPRTVVAASPLAKPDPFKYSSTLLF